MSVVLKLHADPIRSPARQREATFHAFLRATGRVRQLMDAYFAGFGVTAPAWGILRALQRAEAEGLHELRLTDLGERVLIRPAGMSGSIDRMERQGWVKRTLSKDDRRERLVSLEPAGRKLLETVLKNHESYIASLFEPMGCEDLRQIEELITYWGEHLDRLCKEPKAPRKARRH